MPRKRAMTQAVSRNGIGVLYTCYKLPGHGKYCEDNGTDKCFKCKYCKAEMSAFDATKLINSYGRK